jgi:hypothetical protein
MLYTCTFVSSTARALRAVKTRGCPSFLGLGVVPATLALRKQVCYEQVSYSVYTNDTKIWINTIVKYYPL